MRLTKYHICNYYLLVISPDLAHRPTGLETRRQFLATFLKSAGVVGLSAIGLPIAFTQAATASQGLNEQVKTLNLADTSLAFYDPKPPVKIGPSDLKLISVAHWPPTYKKYKPQLESDIQKASWVGLEYCTPEIQNYGRLSQSEEALMKQPAASYNELVYRFFGSVARLCAKYGKDIIVVNPQNMLTYYTDLYAQKGALKSTAALGGAEAVDILLKKLKHMPLSRRDLFKSLPLFATAAVSAYGAAARSMGQVPNSPFHTEMDLRDTGSALGLQKQLSDEHNAHGLLIQGAGHDNVLQYLRQDPAKTKEHYSNYAIGSRIGTPLIQRFHYNSQTDTWNLLEATKYF